MTRKEFCELMAAGHEQAAANLNRESKRIYEKRGEHWTAAQLECLADQEEALGRAFRDLAKEQDDG